MTRTSLPPVSLAGHGPYDECGRVLHPGDLTAQLALAVVRLEQALAEAGLAPADLVRITVRTTGQVPVEEVLDRLVERLEAVGADPLVGVERVDRLPDPGMLVAIDAVADPDPGRPTLMVVVAHPDDEAFGCGSVLAHAAAHGWRSVVVCATRGELGEPAPASGLRPEQLPAAREAELRAACRVLGVGRVELLGHLDSGTTGPPAAGALVTVGPARLQAQVAALVDEVRPDVVVTLDGGDGHRDHAAIRDATLAALDRVDHRPLRTYLHCLPGSLMTELTGLPLGTRDEEITTVVDVASLLDRRWHAIRAHESQVPPFDAMDARLQHAFLATDHLRRVDPPWAGGPVETTWRPVPVTTLWPRLPADDHPLTTIRDGLDPDGLFRANHPLT